MSAMQTRIPHKDSQQGLKQKDTQAYLSNMTGGREE